MNSALALVSPGRGLTRAERRVLSVFSLGEVVGGVVTGALLALIGGLLSVVPEEPRLLTAGLLWLLLLGHEAGIWRLPLPQNRRQVPQEVFLRGRGAAALQFGFEMGTGVRTYVPAVAPYAVGVFLLLANPTLVLGVVTGAGFGLGRAAMIWSRSSATDAGRWDQGLRRRTGILQGVSATAVVAGLAWLVTAH